MIVEIVIKVDGNQIEYNTDYSRTNNENIDYHSERENDENVDYHSERVLQRSLTRAEINYFNTNDTDKMKQAVNHVNEIQNALQNQGLVRIDYHVSDWYAKLFINTDKAGTIDDGFKVEQIINRLNKASPRYSASFGLHDSETFDGYGNAIFETRRNWSR